MDISMPVLNGLDAAAAISKFSSVPIILFSQHAHALDDVNRFPGVTRIVSKDEQHTLIQNAEELCESASSGAGSASSTRRE
jgi:CheY-like chemotaxis protein